MSTISSLALMLILWAGQVDDRPPYVREGDRVEQEFLAYRERLNTFFTVLRGMIDQQPPSRAAVLPRLQQQDAPLAVSSRYGFGLLPRIVDTTLPASPPVSVFNYSWPITDGYIAGEKIKLDQADATLRNLSNVSNEEKSAVISNLILEYRKLLANQRTIDQYVRYNQFWQRALVRQKFSILED